jgi:hypothetical protein
VGAWVPARYLTTYVQTGFTRDHALSLIRHMLEKYDDLDSLVEHNPISSGVGMDKDTRQSLLFLDWAIKSAENQAIQADEYVKQSLKRIWDLEKILNMESV